VTKVMLSLESSISRIQTVRFDLSPVSEPIAAWLRPVFWVCPVNRVKNPVMHRLQWRFIELPEHMGWWVGRLRPSSADCQIVRFRFPTTTLLTGKWNSWTGIKDGLVRL